MCLFNFKIFHSTDPSKVNLPHHFSKYPVKIVIIVMSQGKCYRVEKVLRSVKSSFVFGTHLSGSLLSYLAKTHLYRNDPCLPQNGPWKHLQIRELICHPFSILIPTLSISSFYLLSKSRSSLDPFMIQFNLKILLMYHAEEINLRYLRTNYFFWPNWLILTLIKKNDKVNSTLFFLFLFLLSLHSAKFVKRIDRHSLIKEKKR